MRPSFNISGPCIPGEHYMLPPERRLGRVLRLIDDHKYFTLHAGRQTGKTTSARWLVRHLNAEGRFRAVWVDVETAREEPDPARAFPVLLDAFERSLSRTFPELRPDPADIQSMLQIPASALLNYLAFIASRSSLPLVVLVDEADGLVGATMVSFLTQLRDGYLSRDIQPFPSSVALIGQRQVRDYALNEHERRATAWLGTTSPFNVTAEAATIGNFTEDEVAELLVQHTEQTGQRFAPEAVRRIYELGQGHPWLTNALADQIVTWDVEERSVTIRAAHVEAAKETLIRERRSHIDLLIARLREPRVRRILAPMLVGERPHGDMLDDDLAYAAGLGLIAIRDGAADIANPIYREIIPRALTWSQQVTIPHETAWYVRDDGGLDVAKLLKAFQVFWRQDGHLAADGFGYREAGPHLMLMAFLQRVANGGGQVEREYGLGRRALDLMVRWRGEAHAIEVKLRRDTETEEEALAQVAGYLDGTGLGEGWLVRFDLRKDLSWAEKLTLRDVERDGKQIHIVGC